MPVDVESELARLGAAWTASVAHVEVAEVLERTMPARSEPPTIEQIDVLAEPPTGHRGRVLAVAAVVVLLVAATVVGLVWGSRPSQPSSPTPTPISTAIVNGWVAFASSSAVPRASDPGPGDDGDGEEDVYLVREGSSPRRITGSDTDLTDEICPAISPDGTQLAFGQATGDSDKGYSGDGAVVITDLSAEGVRTATTTIALAGATHPPCAIWSADGRWLAFGVESPAGGPDRRIVDEVWVVDTEADDIRRLSGLKAIDFDWAPDAPELAIASDGVVLYSVTADELHPLGDAQDVGSVAWSPDGQTIAFMRGPPSDSVATGDLWLMDADGTNERLVVPEVDAMHGLGPMWSPDDERIAYQRRCARNPATSRPCGEETEVVLLTVNPDDPREPAGTEVVIAPPQTTGPDGQPMWWFPFSVTWSPDGTALLYYAWAESADGFAHGDAVVAVSLDGETPPVVLSGDLVVSGSMSWGRQQAN
jgi:hypothetical protein